MGIYSSLKEARWGTSRPVGGELEKLSGHATTTDQQTAPPAISFIIPVLNDEVSLRRCLASIKAASVGIPSELIVVDNGSTDNSVDVALRHGCQVITSPELRVSGLRNLGARLARAPVLAFVDADHEIVTGWTAAALDTLTMQSIDGTGYPYRRPIHSTWVQELYDGLRKRPASLEDTAWLGSGNLAVRASAFSAIGGFDTSLVACEDVDLCIRIRTSGKRLVADPRLVSVHHGDPTTLCALFTAELWRGRNNLRVSLRGPVSLRSVPSILIPLIALACLGTAAISGLAGNNTLAAAAILSMVTLSGMRAYVLSHRADMRGPLGYLRALAFALTYDTARALALVLQVGHRRNKREPVQ